MDQERFFHLLAKGAKIIPLVDVYRCLVDTTTNANVAWRTREPFDFKDLDEDGQNRFIALLNAGRVEFDGAGRFLVLPFFLKGIAKD